MDPAERFIRDYIDEYIKGNAAARLVQESLMRAGIGLLPLVDHCAIRTHDVEFRAREVEKLGFVMDRSIGVLEYDNWWARVYRKPGCPAIFIDQAYDGDRGRGSVIPEWVTAHGDRRIHHIAVLVDDIEYAIGQLASQGIRFAGEVIGDKGTDLRQIFTQPEIRSGKAFTVLELIERHNGYLGFLPPQANGLMESTRLVQ